MTAAAKLDVIVQVAQVQSGSVCELSSTFGIAERASSGALLVTADPLVKTVVADLIALPLGMVLIGHHPGFHRPAYLLFRSLVSGCSGLPGHTRITPRSS